MATTTLELTDVRKPRRGSNLRSIFIIIILFTTGLYGVIAANSHTETKHGQEGVDAHNCIERYGAEILMFNPLTKHYAECAQISEGRFAIRISKQVDGEFHEITAYQKLTDFLYEIEEHLNELGYMLMGQ